MKTKVSGHSGLLEEVELRMLAEKAMMSEIKRKTRFEAVLNLMNSLGIAPHERKSFIIEFAKWIKQEGLDDRYK